MIAIHPFLAQTLEQARSKTLDYSLLACLVLLVAGAVAVGAREVFRLSLTRLWALALQTFRESVRRRVLLLIPGAMVLIVAIGLFQQGINEVSEIHQATEGCIRITSALTLLMMILLSAFAFPREIESRTIYSLLTKPVTRLEVFLGKLIGLWMVAAVVLALMGTFSYAYLHVRASRLAAKARAGYDRDKHAYDEYLKAARAAGQPTSAPAGTRLRAAPAIHPTPPDEALRQHLDMGLLTALNFHDSEPVRLHPVVPKDYPAQRDWMLTGRGYMGVYTLNLPAGDNDSFDYNVDLVLDIPAAAEDERPQASIRLLIPALTEETRTPAWSPPPAVAQEGWGAGVSEPFTVKLARGQDRLWHGGASVPRDLLRALGPTPQLGLGVEVMTQQPRLVGFLQPSTDPKAVHGLELNPATDRVVNRSIRPTRLVMIPRTRSIFRFTLAGSPLSGPNEVAEYQFDNIPLADLPEGDDLVFQLRFDVDKGSPQSIETRASIVVLGPSGKQTTLFATPSTRMSSFIHVKRDLVHDGRLVLQVRPKEADDTFTLSTRSVRLVVRPTPVAVNLFKSMLICEIEAMVVVALGVMASVFLSWPVALLFTSVMVIAGNLLDMVRGLLANPAGASIFDETGDDKAIAAASRVGNEFFKYSSRLIERIVPDFTRFDPQAFVGQGLSIPWRTLGVDVLWALAYMGVAMAIGYLTLHYKEVAK